MKPIPATSDLELRPFTPADAPVLFATIERNRAWLRRWLPWIHDGYSISDSLAFLTEAQKLNEAGASLATGIWNAGNFCGAVALHRIDPFHRCTSIGYWIDEASSGRGIMTSACRAIICTGFDKYNLNRIEIRCAVGNERSCAIPKRLGFAEEGLLREAEWLYDHWVDLKLFAVLKRTWRELSYRY